MSEKALGKATVEILSKGMDQCVKDMNRLKTEFDKAANAGTNVGKVGGGIGGVLSKAMSGIGESISKAVGQFAVLGDAIGKAGTVAQVSFAAGSAAIGKFISMADPQGMTKLQGTLGQIGVQIGSIFIPLLDKLQASLEGVLEFLRGLDDAQKDSIAKWAAMAGSIALGVAILPKLIGLIQAAGVAIRILGAIIGIASGGIVPLIGLLVAGAAAFAAYNMSAEDMKGVMSSVMGVITPLIEPLKNLASTIMNILMKAFEALAPAVTATVRVVMQVVDVLMAVIAQIVDTFEEMLKAIEPTITWLVKMISLGFEVIAAVIGGVIAGLQPVWDGLIEVIQVVGDVFNAIFDLIGEALSGFGLSTEQAGGIFTKIFDGIKEALLFLKPLFTAVIGSIKAEILSLGKVLVYIGSLLKSIATGKWKGALGRAEEAAQELEDRFKKKGEEREEKKKTKKEKDEQDKLDKASGKDKKKDDKRPGRHSGQLNQKLEFVGTSDLWKKAMQATVETPEQKKNQEILDLQKENNKEQKEQTDWLKKIANKKESDDPMGDTGGAYYGPDAHLN